MILTLRNSLGRYPIRWAALSLALYFLAGCGFVGRSAARDLTPPPALSEPAAESPAAKVARLEGELVQAKIERDEARLAGARRLLNWSTGILALCAVVAVAAAIYMRSKMLGGLALACAGAAASCQVIQRALDHIELISWLTFAAVLCVGGWMLWRYHRD